MLIAFGLGIIIATILMYITSNLSHYDIETRAKEMGMVYPDEIKAIDNYIGEE